jgi:hypothetical protein
MARNVQVMSREFLVVNGLTVGIRLSFGNGKVVELKCEDFPAAVRAHAEANGLGEAFRDCGAGKSADEAYAMATKRAQTMFDGQYAARGGARYDWAADILEATIRIMEEAGHPLSDEQENAVEASLVEITDADTAKAWAKKNPKRKAVMGMVDVIRKERAAAAAKAGGTAVDIADII